VVDTVSKEPLRAKINLDGHDTEVDRSFIFADTMGGVSNYHRLVAAGTYTATFSCQGCQSKTIRDIRVTNGKATIVNVELDCGTSGIANDLSKRSDALISIKQLHKGIKIDYYNIQGVAKAVIYDVKGKIVRAFTLNPGIRSIVWEAKDAGAGYYILYLQAAEGRLTKSFMVN
jgi:hypothetical protein